MQYYDYSTEQYAVRESKIWIALPDGGVMGEEDFKKRWCVNCVSKDFTMKNKLERWRGRMYSGMKVIVVDVSKSPNEIQGHIYKALAVHDCGQVPSPYWMWFLVHGCFHCQYLAHFLFDQGSVLGKTLKMWEETRISWVRCVKIIY